MHCRCVGNSVEVEESLQCLRGGGARDLRELVVLQVRTHHCSTAVSCAMYCSTYILYCIIYTLCTVLSTHSVLQGAMLLVSSGQVATLEQGEARIREVLDTGAALDKFRMMILRQVGQLLMETSDRLYYSLILSLILAGSGAKCGG